MNYIVFDLEWNQSPEGKERSDRYLQFEIVEIGAVKLDQNRKPIGEFRRLVKPQVYEELHFKIQEVTGLEMELLLREGQPFGSSAIIRIIHPSHTLVLLLKVLCCISHT